MHEFLMFRGQDIKDLHVHENQTTKDEEEVVEAPAKKVEEKKQPAPAPPQAVAKAPAAKPDVKKAPEKKAPPQKKQQQPPPQKKPETPKVVNYASKVKDGAQLQQGQENNKPQKKTAQQSGNKGKSQNMVGTGASLMNRKVRGAKGDQG